MPIALAFPVEGGRRVIKKLLGAGGAVVLVAAAWACGEAVDQTPPQPMQEAQPPGGAPPEPEPVVPPSGENPLPDTSGTGAPPPDEGGGGGGGTTTPTPPVGQPTPPAPDPGTGTPPPVEAVAETWPKDAVLNLTQRYGAGRPQSVAVDDAFNIWLLDGKRIGVLRPGATQPLWAENIGQAGLGFSSTVICGGIGGRAYVGYYARELDQPKRDSYKDATFLEGDLDVVKLTADGKIVLEEHLTQSFRRSKEANDGSLTWNPPNNTGIRNSNSWQYDEDRAVLSCVKVMRGRDKGDVYIGTNHGVTRIQGLKYNSHRHPVWWNEKGSQMAGYTYSVGIAQDGDVLIGNDWTFGIVTPNKDLGVWDWMSPKSLNPMKVESSFLPEVNSLPEFDRWRGFQQTKDGKYYLASRDLGLWEMTITGAGNRAQKGTKVEGLSTNALTSLAATDDGSLFVGTSGSGLWRMDAQKRFTRIADVPGGTVKQLVYDPNATPSMLYVLTDAGLTVLRGY
jgi:hypothetical protein